MAKTPARYSYRNKKNGNVIRISSELTSPDWELVKDDRKVTDTDEEETAQDATGEAAQAAPEDSKASDTSPAEKPAEATAAAKKKSPSTASKKSTGKKV